MIAGFNFAFPCLLLTLLWLLVCLSKNLLTNFEENLIVSMSPTHSLSQEIQVVFSTMLYCFFQKKLVYIYCSVVDQCPAVSDGPLGNTPTKKVLRRH